MSLLERAQVLSARAKKHNMFTNEMAQAFEAKFISEDPEFLWSSDKWLDLKSDLNRWEELVNEWTKTEVTTK